jgi:hypothetical protein
MMIATQRVSLAKIFREFWVNHKKAFVRMHLTTPKGVQFFIEADTHSTVVLVDKDGKFTFEPKLEANPEYIEHFLDIIADYFSRAFIVSQTAPARFAGFTNLELF